MSAQKIDYTLMDKPRRKRWQPDPRDLADHREYSKNREAIREAWQAGPDPAYLPPTDDAPVSALEAFGVDCETLGILYTRLPTVGDARRAIAHPEEEIRYFGEVGRQQVAQALAAADKWLAGLAENPPVSS
jgi:hypothetical protein